MSDLLLRAGILAFASLLAWAIVWSGRRFVENRRRAAFATPSPLAEGQNEEQAGATPIRILVFSSDDCYQCHQFQMPALRRVTEARKHQVSVDEIDAPTSPELTQRYHVLTLPTTVVLDAAGRVLAVNYGFANTQLLLEQVDAALATSVEGAYTGR